ncbi:hypothetical protein PsorP6_013220 [Peronosclerospora sorghi]|uniref:Uncharacterized protein n=1 Tax=Peronosclerospora sorghi TaxID=230839 RepID=A0ACC0WFM5_9STRA|nr:hypothetical protein PsorP6_013220 [Peronosclerospora sorghi]
MVRACTRRKIQKPKPPPLVVRFVTSHRGSKSWAYRNLQPLASLQRDLVPCPALVPTAKSLRAF